MAAQAKLARVRTVLALGAVSWLALAPAAWGQDLAGLVAKTDPSVVTIVLEQNSQGSGFVVDAKGLIVTNYHVIEGAKAATVTFPNKRSFPVKGFLAILPGKDLALIQIDPAGQQLPVLRVSEAVPAKGERVFAFGAPMGLSGSVSDGIVAAIRAGTDVRDTLLKLANQDIYQKTLGYDLDAQWIQTTAPISPGNSGGPLVNAQGEVVGINSWAHALGQNLNFALCSVHIKQFLAGAGTNLQPLASLPPPRPSRKQGLKGDAQKSLALWKQLNRLKNEVNEGTAALEKKIQQIVPMDPRNPMRGRVNRLKKLAVLFEQMSKAHLDYAAKVKALKTSDVDLDLLGLSVVEADLGQRMGDVCKQISGAMTSQSEEGIVMNQARLEGYRRAALNVRTVRDMVRIKLKERFQKDFPTLEETAQEPDPDESEEPEKKAGEGKAAATASTEPAEEVERAVLRIWTDRSGRHQIQAKYRGTEDGKVKLERADGTVLSVPLEKLSEADQRFLGKAQ